VASSKPQSTQPNQEPLITFSSPPPAHSQPPTANAIVQHNSSYDPWHSKHLALQNRPPAMYPSQNPLGVVTPPQPSKKVLDTRTGTGMTPPPTTRGNIKIDPNPVPTNTQPCYHMHSHSQPMNVSHQHPTQHPFGPPAPTLGQNGPQYSLGPSQSNPPVSHLTQQVLTQHNAMYPPQPNTNLINLDSNPPVMSSTKFLNQANRVTQPSPPSVQQPLLPLHHQYSHTLPTQVPHVTIQPTVKLDPHFLHSHPLPQHGTHQHPTPVMVTTPSPNQGHGPYHPAPFTCPLPTMLSHCDTTKSIPIQRSQAPPMQSVPPCNPSLPHATSSDRNYDAIYALVQTLSNQAQSNQNQDNDGEVQDELLFPT
jgi:hypothetical protein